MKLVDRNLVLPVCWDCGASLPCRWVATPGRMLELPEFRGAIF